MELAVRRKYLLDLVSKTGKYVASKFRKISRCDLKNKSKYEIVTTTDIEAESLIIDAIRKKFPHDSILSEEAGGINEAESFLWIIDPIDGTTNFYIGNPVFTTSIAIAYNNNIVMGATYHPILHQMFFVEKGNGFFLNSKKSTVSKTSDLSEAFIAFCHGPDVGSVKKITAIYSKLKSRCKALRQLGSASFELALAASGNIDAFIMPGVLAWDVAAGSLMVREASGCLVDLQGREWSLNSQDIVASNKHLSDTILTILD